MRLPLSERRATIDGSWLYWPFNSPPTKREYFGYFSRSECHKFVGFVKMMKSKDELYFVIVRTSNGIEDQVVFQFNNPKSDPGNTLEYTINSGLWEAKPKYEVISSPPSPKIRYKWEFQLSDSLGIIKPIDSELYQKEDFKEACLDVLEYISTLTQNEFKSYRDFDLEDFNKKYLQLKQIKSNESILVPNYKSKSTKTSDLLSSLIGLKTVKEEVDSVISYAKVRKQKLDRGLLATPSTLHMVFTGNPGTGKTTVARMIGETYKEIGLLKKGHLVETSRTELVGEYVGHTAPKTRKVFESALGGVLFIDEAYTLNTGSEKDFGQEAINELLALMENHREEIVVIVAGYPDLMKQFIESNPGLDSRFPTKIHFDDYSTEELLEILRGMATKQQHGFTPEALEKAKAFLIHELEQNPNFGNARGVRNLYERIEKAQSSRLAKQENPTDEALVTFEEGDVPGI